ncbi:MAG TPA: arginyltransferase [Geminicoccaceae bacterium]|nr:arginyltransferase [Geminicoccaceae bacterium]
MHLFFSTELAACPYLPDRVERRLVTSLDGADADARHEQLMQVGFRRAQRFAYRPACPGCRACVPVRIPVARFAVSRGWRRILRRNADLVAGERPLVATEEQFALFSRYLAGRHAEGGMTAMSWPDYRAMIDDSPVAGLVAEWRRPDGSLIAASLTDRCASGLSGVYKFFDPDEGRRSLGSLIVLWHVQRARELGLPYVYLGYWVAGSLKMAYKARFRPLEQLTVDGWQPLPDEADEADGEAAEPAGRQGRISAA